MVMVVPTVIVTVVMFTIVVLTVVAFIVAMLNPANFPRFRRHFSILFLELTAKPGYDLPTETHKKKHKSLAPESPKVPNNDCFPGTGGGGTEPVARVADILQQVFLQTAVKSESGRCHTSQTVCLSTLLLCTLSPV